MTNTRPPFFCFVAHGSTRPRWKTVVETAMTRWQDVHGLRASLYLLNDSSQTFEDYLLGVYRSGEARIEVIPLFVAPGGHVLDDLHAVTTRLEESEAGALQLTVHETLLESTSLVDFLGQALSLSAEPLS